MFGSSKHFLRNEAIVLSNFRSLNSLRRILAHEMGKFQKRALSGNTWDPSACRDRSCVGAGSRESLVTASGRQRFALMDGTVSALFGAWNALGKKTIHDRGDSERAD
jgi:hypothetical protein